MKLTQTLLEWSLTSALLILVISALRALLGKRVSAGLRYALWAVVLARLLVPVQIFTSPIAGVWAVTEIRTEKNVIEVPSAPDVDGLASDEVSGSAPAFPSPPDVPEPPAAPDLTKLPAVLGWIWLGGSAVTALVLLASNLKFNRKLRRVRVPLEGTDCPLPVCVSDSLPSPCLFGLVRPMVYVTPDVAENPDMLRHVLAHEYTHYRHGDHVWNLLRSVALAVHWWNPLVWLAAVLSRRDCELACDEGALRLLGDGARIAYGRTLLALLAEKPRAVGLLTCATTMTGGQKSVFERVTRIARAPKCWLWAAVAAVLATALACVCAFGSAAEEKAPEDGPDHPPQKSESFNLSFALNDQGNVEISGTVNDLTLGEGTYWHPAVDEMHPITYLAIHDIPFITGDIEAWWGDDERKSVMVSTLPSTRDKEGGNNGFWTFTVDLSDGAGVVTEMASLASTPAQIDSDTPLRLYPESISDEGAAISARIAATLLTEAEDYYNSVTAPETESTPKAAGHTSGGLLRILPLGNL